MSLCVCFIFVCRACTIERVCVCFTDSIWDRWRSTCGAMEVLVEAGDDLEEGAYVRSALFFMSCCVFTNSGNET